MLSQWVVTTYKTLVEIALWVFLVTGGLIGAGMGSMLGHGFMGLIIGAVTSFFGMAVFLGAALVLGEIQKSVQDIQSKLQQPNETRDLLAAKVNSLGRVASVERQSASSPASSPVEQIIDSAPANTDSICPKKSCSAPVRHDDQTCWKCNADFSSPQGWKPIRP